MSLDDIPTAAQLRDNLRQRIVTLERERDEARAAYCALRDWVQSGKCMSWGETESALRHFDYQQEWRKGCA